MTATSPREQGTSGIATRDLHAVQRPPSAATLWTTSTITKRLCRSVLDTQAASRQHVSGRGVLKGCMGTILICTFSYQRPQ
jgi:hypothetical protein